MIAKLTVILSLIIWTVPVQDKLVKTQITEGVKVSLPETFYPMQPSDLAQRYPSVRKPIGAYTNESRMVDFSVNISATQWRESDVEIAKGFFKASIYNLYDQVSMIKEEIQTINKRDFIVFEFESRIDGDHFTLSKKDPVRKYTYIQYLIINRKTIVFSFSCPIQLKERWQPVAPEIMNSIKVKKNI